MLIASNALAVTDFGITIKSSGGDYTSISTAESVFDFDILNMVVASFDASSGTIPDNTACTTDSGATSGNCVHQSVGGQLLITGVSGGTFDDNDVVTDGTNTVTLSSGTDSAYIVMTVYIDLTSFTFDGGTYHSNDGSWHNVVTVRGDTTDWNGTPSGMIQITAGGVSTVNMRDRFISLQNFYITGSDDSTVALSFNATSSNLICDGCGFGAGYEISSNFAIRLVNSVSIDSPGFGFTNYPSSSVSVGQQYYNCVAINAGSYGFSKGDVGTVYAYNSASFGATSGDFASTVVGNYNACSDTSCNIFTNYVSGLTMANEITDGANGDVHLKSGSNLIDAGYDYSGATGVDYDIDNVTRSGTWDIGADEYVAAGVTDFYSGRGIGRGISRGVFR